MTPATLPISPPETTNLDSYLSSTRLSLYQQCPLRYYFKYVARLPEPTVAASLVFGSAIHRAVEHHFRELLIGNPPPELEALAGEYAAAWQEVDLTQVAFTKEDDRTTLDELARKMLAAFQRSPLAQPAGRILGVEEPLRGPIVAGCPELVARLDLVVETDSELVITDLKTSRARWGREQAEDQAGQLLLYGELARTQLTERPLRLQFAVLTKTREPSMELWPVEPRPARIARQRRIVERVWRAIEGELFYPAPSPLACPSCPFREPCRHWSG